MSGSAQKRYEQLASARGPYLSRARDGAKLTIPSLMPPEGATGSTQFYTPFQNVGTEGVNTLAAKLLLTLFPPNRPLMKLGLPADLDRELADAGEKGQKIKSEMEAALGAIERRVTTEIEAANIRAALFEMFRQLICSGNVLIYSDKSFNVRVFRLDQYVVRRSPKGVTLEIVVKEAIAPELLPEGVRQKAPTSTSVSQEIDLYTHIRRVNSQYEVHQEALGEIIPGTQGTYPLDGLPWLCLRWRRLDGEHYGRGHVEEYIGDLSSLEGLTQAIVEGSAGAAKMLWLVDPNGTTNPTDVANAPNLAVRAGRATDVTVAKADKYGDFRVTLDTMAILQRRLAQAFLLTSSVTRDAERVTAEEIRLMAAELEDALGGVYSLLATELLLPLVKHAMMVLTANGAIPPLPNNIKPTVIAGMEALGRGVNLQLWMTFAATMQKIIGPEAFASVVDLNALATEVGTGLGIEVKRILKTKEQLAAEQAQTRQDALRATLGPAAIQANAKLAEQAQGGK